MPKAKKPSKLMPFVVGTFLLVLFSFVMLAIQSYMMANSLNLQTEAYYRSLGTSRSAKVAPNQPKAVMCTDVYAPVCGTNGITYGNKCYAGVANVQLACETECPCALSQPSATTQPRQTPGATVRPIRQPVLN